MDLQCGEFKVKNLYTSLLHVQNHEEAGLDGKVCDLLR